MNQGLVGLLESIMIVTALSVDALVAGFSYGVNGIKIPFYSVTIINVVCSTVLAASLFLGSVLEDIIPENFTHVICFFILFVMGLYKLICSVVSIIVSRKAICSKIKFRFFGLSFCIRVFSEEEKECNFGCRKIMGAWEAFSLAIALSLDGLAVGVGAALVNSNSLEIVALSLISDMVAVMFGAYLGGLMAKKIKINLSWLSGTILLVLAFMKL